MKEKYANFDEDQLNAHLKKISKRIDSMKGGVENKTIPLAHKGPNFTQFQQMGKIIKGMNQDFSTFQSDVSENFQQVKAILDERGEKVLGLEQRLEAVMENFKKLEDRLQRAENSLKKIEK